MPFLSISGKTRIPRAVEAEATSAAQVTGELRALRADLDREKKRRVAAERALAASEARARTLLDEARSTHAELRQLARQALCDQEDTRKEISRELHDTVAQTLAAINAHLAALSKTTRADEGALRRRIARTQQLVERSVEVVHRYARDLRPALLDNLGLIPALHSYMREFTARTGVPIRFSACAGVEKLASLKRTVLYRVAQEALTNVARHALATGVVVGITRDANQVTLVVEDNGVSFDPADDSAARRQRLGLVGMRERVEMLGGTLRIESAPGRGTRVCATIPGRERRGR